MKNITHVLITSNKIKYFLSALEAQSVAKAIQSNGKMIMIQGDVVSLQIIPSLINVNRWYEQEAERLYQQNKTMCRNCFAITDSERCGCRDITDPSRILGAPKEDYQPVRPETIAAVRAKLNQLKNENAAKA